MKKNKLIIIVFIGLLSFFLTGCWDYEDINRRSIGITVGIDLDGDYVKYVGENVKLTFNTQSNGLSGQGGQYVYITTAKGIKFEDFRYEYDRKVPYSDFSGAMRALVFSEKYATRGIETYLNRINLSYSMRNSSLVTISKEDVLSLLEGGVNNNISVGFALESTINSLTKDGKAIYITIGNIISNISEKNLGYVIPYINKNEKSISLDGYAVMKDSKLIGIIYAKEANGLLYLLNKKASLDLNLKKPDNDNIISYTTSVKKKHIKTRFEKGIPIIDINIEMSSILKYLYYIESISKFEVDKIEKIIEERAKEDIQYIINKSQKQYQCDFLDLGRYFKSQNYKVYNEIDWGKTYPKAKINIKVKNKIRHTNLVDTNAKVKK